MKKVNYITVEELLEDDSFLVWYHQTDKKKEDKWCEWAAAGSENQRLANEAIRFLDLIMMAKENIEITEQQIKTTFVRITNAIDPE